MHNSIKLFYSHSVLGHFTIVVLEPIDMISHRIHLIDKDAISSKSGWGKRAFHKVTQVSGSARGELLHDTKSTAKKYLEYKNYDSHKERQLINQWQASSQEIHQLLAYAKKLTLDAKKGKYINYGYFIYANDIDNCGSIVVKMLEKANIKININNWKAYFNLPRLIKNDISTLPSNVPINNTSSTSSASVADVTAESDDYESNYIEYWNQLA